MKVEIRTKHFSYHLAGRPSFFHIEDTQMEANEICVAGWAVGTDKGDLIVGTVVSYRKGDVVTHLKSHDHVYIKNLPGRKVTAVYPIKDYCIVS